MSQLKKIVRLANGCNRKDKRTIKEYVQQMLAVQRFARVIRHEGVGDAIKAQAGPATESLTAASAILADKDSLQSDAGLGDEEQQQQQQQHGQQRELEIWKRLKPSRLLRGKSSAVRAVASLMDQLHSKHFGDSIGADGASKRGAPATGAGAATNEEGVVVSTAREGAATDALGRTSQSLPATEIEEADVTRPATVGDETVEAANSAGESQDAAAAEGASSSQDEGSSVDINSIIESIFGKPLNKPSTSATLLTAQSGVDLSRQTSISTITATIASDGDAVSSSASVPSLLMQNSASRSTELLLNALPNRDAGNTADGYRPKIVLSRFRDEAIAEKEAQQLTARLEEQQLNRIAAQGERVHVRSEVIPEIDGDDAEYYYFNRNCSDAQAENFSSSGFKVIKELQQKQRQYQQQQLNHFGNDPPSSMLSMLRSYAGVQAPPIAAPCLPPHRQRGAMIQQIPASGLPHNGEVDSRISMPDVGTGNMLQVLRALPKSDYQSNTTEYFI